MTAGHATGQEQFGPCPARRWGKPALMASARDWAIARCSGPLAILMSGVQSITEGLQLFVCILYGLLIPVMESMAPSPSGPRFPARTSISLILGAGVQFGPQLFGTGLLRVIHIGRGDQPPLDIGQWQDAAEHQ